MIEDDDKESKRRETGSSPVEPVGEGTEEAEGKEDAGHVSDAYWEESGHSKKTYGERTVVTRANKDARAAMIHELRIEATRELCRRVAGGESMRAVTQDPSMPNVSTFLQWAAEDAEISMMYHNALKMRAAALAEDIVDHCQTLLTDKELSPARVQALKVVINTKQWAMARLLPKLYGDHQIIEHTGEVKMDEAQIDARLKHLLERIKTVR
jgi:hypothetical protein